MSAPLPVSIVICTYNRPLLLEAAVRSCLANATRTGAAYEIVIADNSREGHAEPLIQRLLAEQVTVPVRRVPAAPPNISIARNAGIAATRTPLVAFLDDDLEIEPGWLDALCRTLDATGADVAIGPVRPRFVGGAPDWDPEGRHFTRVLGRPTGAAISAAGPDKPHGFALSTASSLWRRDSCFTDPQPFDPAFSGGEDFDLFLRLQARGRRFVWCAEAGVWETVPHGRTRVGYYLLRACLGA